MNLIPDFGMPGVVAKLYRIWYEFHTSFFAVHLTCASVVCLTLMLAFLTNVEYFANDNFDIGDTGCSPVYMGSAPPTPHPQ